MPRIALRIVRIAILAAIASAFSWSKKRRRLSDVMLCPCNSPLPVPRVHARSSDHLEHVPTVNKSIRTSRCSY